METNKFILSKSVVMSSYLESHKKVTHYKAVVDLKNEEIHINGARYIYNDTRKDTSDFYIAVRDISNVFNEVTPTRKRGFNYNASFTGNNVWLFLNTIMSKGYSTSLIYTDLKPPSKFKGWNYAAVTGCSSPDLPRIGKKRWYL